MGSEVNKPAIAPPTHTQWVPDLPSRIQLPRHKSGPAKHPSGSRRAWWILYSRALRPTPHAPKPSNSTSNPESRKSSRNCKTKPQKTSRSSRPRSPLLKTPSRIKRRVEKAKSEVVKCLRANDRRPLDCWKEVETFRQEVRRLESTWVEKIVR